LKYYIILAQLAIKAGGDIADNFVEGRDLFTAETQRTAKNRSLLAHLPSNLANAKLDRADRQGRESGRFNGPMTGAGEGRPALGLV
jgi:hypothetical protein